MNTYDIIVIGMGPAGMAVSAMGTAMGLKVLTIEKDKVGGECLNVGCIPSKALLKAANAYEIAKNLKKYGFITEIKVDKSYPMRIVREKIKGINDKKFMKVFEKVEIIKGIAKFIDSKTVGVNEKKYKAKKIFIATGTQPMIPPIKGLADVPKLTNVNMFDIDNFPKTLTIIGGGAIGCEMAQSFARLGTIVTIVHMDDHLLPIGDYDASQVLEKKFKEEKIQVFNSACISKVEKQNDKIIVTSDKGKFSSDQILVATGRSPILKDLDLEVAGIKYTKSGITVNQHMKTNKKNIYAIGDCNGHALLSHAAMHQGMLALMDAVSPFSLPQLKRDKYLVPWSVFTQPEVSQVGLTEKQAKEKGLKFSVTKKEYKSYGRTVADGNPEGFIKILTSSSGKIYGATIIGDAASDIIHEWVLAMQYGKKMHHIMMMMHSFPSISMINKMVAEQWMMEKMNSNFVQRMARFLF